MRVSEVEEPSQYVTRNPDMMFNNTPLKNVQFLLKYFFFFAKWKRIKWHLCQSFCLALNLRSISNNMMELEKGDFEWRPTMN
jgi:hypothetical protein